MGNSVAVQWLGLHAFTAEGAGSIPSQGTKIPQAAEHGQKKQKEKNEWMNFILKFFFIILCLLYYIWLLDDFK